MNIAVYDLATGEILRVCAVPAALAGIQISDGEGWIEGLADDSLNYVELSEPPVIQAKADYTLAALPLPCVVTIEGIEYNCPTQPTFEFNAPGDYEISVDAGPQYLKKVFNVSQT